WYKGAWDDALQNTHAHALRRASPHMREKYRTAILAIVANGSKPAQHNIPYPQKNKPCSETAVCNNTHRANKQHAAHRVTGAHDRRRLGHANQAHQLSLASDVAQPSDPPSYERLGAKTADPSARRAIRFAASKRHRYSPTDAPYHHHRYAQFVADT